MSYNRRDFLSISSGATASLPFMNFTSPQNAAQKLSVHVFSKHLQFLDYKDMAAAAKEIGFDGLDLTVRPKGHVFPERVEEDLPKAIEAIKSQGLQSTMMTTAVENAKNDLDKKVLETAASLGIKYYRMNWLKYPKGETMPNALKAYHSQLKGLEKLNKKLGLVGCYQNHAGLSIGSSMWEVWTLLQKSDPTYLGSQYDIRHAIVEGARSWKNGLQLILPQIRTICLKDFKWEKRQGKWELVNTPMGQGMVDFDAYFKMLKANNIQVPVSLHLEYPLGGANHGATKLDIPEGKVFEAMKNDLAKVHALWDAA